MHIALYTSELSLLNSPTHFYIFMNNSHMLCKGYNDFNVTIHAPITTSDYIKKQPLLYLVKC